MTQETPDPMGLEVELDSPPLPIKRTGRPVRIITAERLAERDAQVRAETHADIARQLDMLASDDELISAWTLTCDPVPLTVADWFRALASKLRAPNDPAVRPVDAPTETVGTPEPPSCPHPVWDGPYRMRCGYRIVDGTCIRHGAIRPAARYWWHHDDANATDNTGLVCAPTPGTADKPDPCVGCGCRTSVTWRRGEPITAPTEGSGNPQPATARLLDLARRMTERADDGDNPSDCHAMADFADELRLLAGSSAEGASDDR